MAVVSRASSSKVARICVGKVGEHFGVDGREQRFVLKRRENGALLSEVVVEVGGVLRRFLKPTIRLERLKFGFAHQTGFERRRHLASFVATPVDSAEKGVRANCAVRSIRHSKSRVRVTIEELKRRRLQAAFAGDVCRRRLSTRTDRRKTFCGLFGERFRKVGPIVEDRVEELVLAVAVERRLADQHPEKQSKIVPSLTGCKRAHGERRPFAEQIELREKFRRPQLQTDFNYDR